VGESQHSLFRRLASSSALLLFTEGMQVILPTSGSLACLPALTQYTSSCTMHLAFPTALVRLLPRLIFSPTRSCTLFIACYLLLVESLPWHRTNPKTPQELRSQFHALCTALDLDPSAKDVLETLRDSSRIPASRITKVIEELGEYGTFRGTLGGSWWPTSSGELDPLESQRSGEFARALRAKGIRSILVGDLSEEWYLYSIAHPLVRSASGSWADSIIEALERYFQPSIVERVCALYPDFPPANDASEKEAMRIFGQLLADGQVHLPVRMLWRDLTSDAARAGDKPSLKVVRYAIRWSPEQVRPEGQSPELLSSVIRDSS
jgi:hypothetical protein